MVQLAVVVAIFSFALNLHEYGHLREARRRGANVLHVAWALLPGIVVLIGRDVGVRFRLGLPYTRWRSGPRTTIQDELWIYRAGSLVSLFAAAVLFVVCYVRYTEWLFATAVACAAVGVVPLMGITRDSDGARIRTLKRGEYSAGEI